MSPESRSPSTRPPKSRTDAIVTTLRSEVLSGQYRPGERLPSERDLAARFATGRGPVREALKMLEQLGIASIQKGGARVVSVDECTLDVLGPLLDLKEIPDPQLVDQVLEIIGNLALVAARHAVEKATPEQMQEIERYTAALLRTEDDHVQRHLALRRLMRCFVDISEHLVLRLIMNGLRTSFMQRLGPLGISYDLDSSDYQLIVAELSAAIDARDSDRVGDAMLSINRYIRHRVRDALEERQKLRMQS